MKNTIKNYYWSRLFYLIVFLIPLSGNSQPKDTLSDIELISLFQYMRKEDKSNLRRPEIRRHVILGNFNTLVRIIKNQGFPRLKTVPKRRKDKYTIIPTSELILIHILQLKPELMLNNEIIQLFDLELKSERMPAPVLQVPMTCMVDSDSTVNTFSPELQEKFYEAMEIWQLDFLPHR